MRLDFMPRWNWQRFVAQPPPWYPVEAGAPADPPQYTRRYITEVMGWTVSPLKICVDILTPHTSERDLIQKIKFVRDIIGLKWGHEGRPEPNGTGVLIRGNWETFKQTHFMPCENEGRDWGAVSSSQGMWKIASKSPAAQLGSWSRFSLRALRRNHPCQHLELRLLASRTVRQYISVF